VAIHAFPAADRAMFEDRGWPEQVRPRGTKGGAPVYYTSCSCKKLNRTAVDFFRPPTSSKQSIVEVVPIGVVLVD